MGKTWQLCLDDKVEEGNTVLLSFCGYPLGRKHDIWTTKYKHKDYHFGHFDEKNCIQSDSSNCTAKEVTGNDLCF